MGENKREKVFLEFPIIETERFILKEIEEKHRNHFISLFSDEDIQEQKFMILKNKLNFILKRLS